MSSAKALAERSDRKPHHARATLGRSQEIYERRLQEYKNSKARLARSKTSNCQVPVEEARRRYHGALHHLVQADQNLAYAQGLVRQAMKP